MAIAKWMGFGATPQATGAGPSATGAQHVRYAKTAVLDKAEKQFGLENFGNTCYVNSVLQALYFCQPFRELVVHVYDKSNPPLSTNTYGALSSTSAANHHTKHARKLSSADLSKSPDNSSAKSVPCTGPIIPPSPPTMFSALRALFLYISNNTLDKGTISPRAFIEKLKKENELFRSTMHQDAHEFLIYLLNKIAEDLEGEVRNTRSRSSSGDDLSNSAMSSGPSTAGTATSGTNSVANSTLVHDLFEGVLTSETRCLTCETVSSRDEAFLDLSLDIEQNSSVTACLRQFSASEMLCQKNKFFCDSCCGLQEAEKRMKIKRLPNVLALHLKRFKYQEDVGKYIKLMYRVAFPLELRLFNTVDDAQDPDRLYELFAIVVHIGNGPHHGHYVAIVKSKGSWVVFDDDTVDTIKESEISKYFGDSNSGCAYVLYYQAIDLDMATLGLKTDDPPTTESVSDPLQVPLLPPGLTHEGDSDASEFAPATPASPANVTVPTIVSNIVPPLSVTIPPSESSILPIPPPVTTPTAASPNGKSGGFFSLRHSPSKPSLGSSSRGSVYNTLSSPVHPMPPLPATLISPPMSTETSEASTSTTSAAVSPNGKVKLSKEKPSGWFARRRSFRPDKEKSPDTPRRPATSQGTREHHTDTSHTSSSASSHALHATDASPRMRTAVSATESLPYPTSPRSAQTRSSTPVSPSAFHNNTPLSLTSSSAPNSLNILADHLAEHLHTPGRKKSQSVLTSPGSSTKLPRTRQPKRPSTANAAVSPTCNTFSRLDEEEASASLTQSWDAENPLSGQERDQRRSSAYVPPPPPSASGKRASRKLSFSGGMLSFGRKDKEKDKDREREREKERERARERQRAAVLSPNSINGPSIVPTNGHL